MSQQEEDPDLDEERQLIREMWLDRAEMWLEIARRNREIGQIAYAEYCESKAWVCEENASNY